MIELSPKQTEAMDAVASENYQFILFGGAVGGGKTVWGLSALLIMCQVFPGSRWCVIRENLEKIRTTTIPSFKKLNASGRLRESPYEYTHPNGSVILFKGENYDNDKELTWLAGLEVSGFLFEEINECRQETLNMAFSRAGRWESTPRPKPIILATCNPANNWVKESVYDRYVSGALPRTWLYIPSRVTDNPHLTEEYLNNLNNLPRYKYMALVEGNWDVQLKTGGEFYKCFEPEQHISACNYNPALALHISWDDNVNPYLPAGIFQIDGNKVMMIDEVTGISPGNTVAAVCADICRRYKGHKSGMFIYGDSTAQKQDTKLEKGYDFFRLIMDGLKEFNPQRRVATVNPSVVSRGQWINAVFEKQTGGISVTFDERCKTAISDFINLKEAPDGTKHKEMDTIRGIRCQKYGHFTDLFDYFMCYAFADAFTKYQAGGYVSKPHVGKNVSKKVY